MTRYFDESVHVCRDPKDDHVLEVAVNGGAACVVPGDADLMAMDPSRGIRILPPAGVLMRLGTETGSGA